MKLVIRREQQGLLGVRWHVWRARCGHLVVAVAPTQQECLERALALDLASLAEGIALAGPGPWGAR